MKHERELRWELVPGKALREIRRHGRRAQEGERHLLAMPVHLQFLLHGSQRVRTGRDIGRPVRPEDEQPRRFAPAGQPRQQVDRGRVAPVQVFQEQDEGRVGAQGVQGLHQLPQHPVARGPLRSALHGLEIRVGQQRRQLGQPGRRMLLEDPHHLFAPGRTTQSSERLEQRQVGFAGAVELHALPTTDAQRLVAVDLREKLFHQRCLADPRLPGHEDQLPPAIHGPLEERVKLRELGRSPHQAQGRMRGSAQGLVPGLGAGRLGILSSKDRSDEPESPPMDRFDVPRRL